MAFEPDTPPPPDTFRRMVWTTVQSLSYLRAYWGRRFVGGLMGLMGDVLSEGATQAFYARLPGHPEQAPDSLRQSGRDRDLVRFRGETEANWKARVRNAWDDYEQAGTVPQLLRVINQWGSAGWPATWNPSNLLLVESGVPSQFTFTLTIPFGMIDPPWVPETYGGSRVYGEVGFFYGLAASTDISMLLYLVRKWKPTRSRGAVVVYWAVSNPTIFYV